MVALAVSDSSNAFDDDVESMSQTVAACRTASVTHDGTSTRGHIDGHVVATGVEIADVASDVARQLAKEGGELLTLLLGRDAPADLPDRLAAEHPTLTVEAHFVGPDTPAVALGLE
jgi:dihydroxyacetone kinase-like predicted kinase